MADDSRARGVYLGTDGGATTSKVAGVWDDGTTVSTRLLQRPTNSEAGPAATVATWVEAIADYLTDNGLAMGSAPRGRPRDPRSVRAVRRLRPLAEPASQLRRVRRAHRLSGRRCSSAPAARSRSSSATTATWAAWRKRSACAARRDATVLMLAPGSGLGCALHRSARPAARRRHALRHGGRPHARAAAPAERRAVPVRMRPHVGLRRGLHDAGGASLSARRAARSRIRSTSSRDPPWPPKQQAFALRGLAQKGDPLAVEIFDFQARALGLHVASLAMALDPQFVVIGGGLMDPEATTEPFRARYLQIVRESGRAVPLADPARGAQRRGRIARRSVAGDRRRARGALPQPLRLARGLRITALPASAGPGSASTIRGVGHGGDPASTWTRTWSTIHGVGYWCVERTTEE